MEVSASMLGASEGKSLCHRPDSPGGRFKPASNTKRFRFINGKPSCWPNLQRILAGASGVDPGGPSGPAEIALSRLTLRSQLASTSSLACVRGVS